MSKLFGYFSTSALWGRGFRPFFLLAAAYSVFCLLAWGGFLGGFVGRPSYFPDPTLWHAHEMLYGFTMAVVAGFLLTAVANWTGWAPVRHFHLFFLCCLWGLGRVALNMSQMPYHLAILIEGLFIPALAISLLVPLYKSRNVRNFIFLFLLGGLFVADMAFMVLQDLRILHVTLLFILMMVSVVGGRIIPAFTVAALRQRGQDVRVTDQKQLDSLCLLSLLGLMLSFISYSEAGAIPAGVAYLAAFLHGLRLRHYHSRRSLVDPLLWILHAGYLWLVVGLFLLGVALGGHLQLSVALHALTVGAIGSLTLGMMCRVALGHTGRALLCSRATVLSFWLIQLAAAVRVLGPLLWPELYLQWIEGATLLWSACFILYLVVFTPLLLRTRPDGQTP
jgi:uncharacterized protein involved in response to NO